MYATTELRPLLAERGIALSREQVYRLVTGSPERLSLATLAALCDILDCGPVTWSSPSRRGGEATGTRGRRRGQRPRPRRSGPGCPPLPAE